MNAEPIHQRESFPERPAIHVAVLSDVDPSAFRWVGTGAEEEGVPCREVVGQAEPRASGGEDPVAAAYAAAQESRLGVGVAAGLGGVYLHEAHMPAERPVWEFPLGGDLRQACRLAGCNAGRMVKRMPLRLEQESTLRAREETSPSFQGVPPPEVAAQETVSPGMQEGDSCSPGAADVTTIVASIVRSLQGRGIL